MKVNYDLHTHSTASDGTLAPAELVRQAAHSNIQVLALTDHDTTAGVAEAASAAQYHGIGFVPGVEISATWGSKGIHIVGLGIDPDCAILRQGLESIREYRLWRAREIGRKLDEKGISEAFEGARLLARGGLIARPHFARYLIAQGVASDMRTVFKRYLVRGKPGFVPSRWVTLNEAVTWIKAAGGQAVIAHPARYSLTRTKLRKLLGEFVGAGGEGLEVVSGAHSREETRTMAFHALDFGLSASMGSDYHGPECSWIELGRLPELPAEAVPIWRDWADSSPL
ncbi:MAG: PHP domain-containing protein [Chromatiaceae bacterium]|nr:PHP domain-containing protein [Chromatiaceae bacterium]MCP5445136.1 PHP domain-containing protein [Chromatiaceae bacterium]